jgi:glycosyltransferase involved in cell wall biosynthesis
MTRRQLAEGLDASNVPRRMTLLVDEGNNRMRGSRSNRNGAHNSAGHASIIEHDRRVDVRGFPGIPTTDSAAALRFCQSLARVWTTTSGLPIGGRVHSVSTYASEDPWQVGSLRPDLSVVIPVFNEEENIIVLYTRLTHVLANMGLEYEVIFVNDGSQDGSCERLDSLAAQDDHLVVVELARNFGHQVAITTGLDHARGNAVVVMDADLQDPPEVLPQFIAKWQEGHDVVYAIRQQRQENWCKRTAYAAFYRLLHRVAHVEIPLDAGDFCIMDRRVVDLLVGMPERNRFVRGMRSWVGLNQVGLAYDRHARHAGKPKYTFSRLLFLALDGLVSFSYMPLRLITCLGFSVSVFSIVMAVFYAIKKLTSGLNPPGFATLIVAIFFLAGIQLTTIGVIGEYVGRVFEEVKQRPLYVVRRVTGKQL